MIQIPYAEVIEKIKEKAGITEQELNSKIEQKLKQLSGLISKEGAAHIIANELGVKLFEKVSGRLQIKNILTGMRDVETVGKIVSISEPREFQTENRAGKVGSLVIGDETGTIRVVCWGNQCDKLQDLTPNTVIKVKGGYVRENQGVKEVHMNDRSLLMVSPKGESIGEVQTTEPSFSRKSIEELNENDSVEVLGTIVQAFEPKFYESCPQCGRRAKPQNGGFVCDQHSTVTPDYAYVLNLFLDDGTENIRVVFFRNHVEKLLDKTRDSILNFREKPEDFEPVKTELLGNIIKVNGRVVKNKMFDRLEIIANGVDTNPDPEKEIEKLKQADAS